MKTFEKIVGALHKGVSVFQAVLLGLLLGMVVYQIGARWIPFLPRALWTEEIARFLLVWVIFLGGAIGVHERTHFVLEILSEHKSRIVNIVWQGFIICMEILFCSIFFFRGLPYAEVMRWDISDVSQISMLWVGAAIPAFGGLSLLFLAELVLKKLHKGAQ
jgi:TRAP-type transport system small permease protein